MAAPSDIMRRPFRRFLRRLATLLLVYLAVGVTLSTTVDPWRINNAPWALRSIDSSRDLHKAMRVGKAALANRGTWQALILGSSRLEIALDPTHPAFRGQRAVNLAMSGAMLYEVLAAGNYALDRNPQVNTIILGIDPGDLHSDADSRSANQYYQSPFADNNRSIERTINQLIGAETLGESIATLQRHFRGIPSEYSPLGQMLTPPSHGNLRKYVESGFVENSIDQWNLRPQILRPQKAELLARFIGRTRDAGIAIQIIVPPQHALKQIHPTENHPDRMAWETDLLALTAICKQANAAASHAPPVKLWTFLTFNSFTTTAMPAPGDSVQYMPGWLDLGHTDKHLGDRVLETLLSDNPPASQETIGMNLLDGDWNTHRAAWIEGHLKYCASHPQDVAWWRTLAARANSRAN